MQNHIPAALEFDRRCVVGIHVRCSYSDGLGILPGSIYEKLNPGLEITM